MVAKRLPALVGMAVTFAMSFSAAARAQEKARIVPTNEFVLTGYGTVGYVYQTQGENVNAFTSSVSPIFLFQFMDRVLFEAELQFQLTEGITETGLEYGQVDFMLNDNLVLIGGKFLVPFGVFGERLHPTWINKFASSPPVYGHQVAAFGRAPLLPILADVGIMARTMFRPGPLSVNLNAYLTQGGSTPDPGAEIPEVEFLASSSDNNTTKMLGGRLDVALPPKVEVNFSVMNGDYDKDNVLDFTAWNVAGEFRSNGFIFRGEYIQTRQEVERTTGFPTMVRQGFYAQASYRYMEWEPVLRWTQVFDDKLGGVLQNESAWQLAVGIDYWFGPSIALMAGYEINHEEGLELDNNRLVAHVAYGF